MDYNIYREPDKAPDRETMLKAMFELKHNPVMFVEEVLKATPSYQQCQVLETYALDGSHTSVRSGHGTGKSCTCSWVILHFLLFNQDCRIPCTAPTGHQLRDILFAELNKWHGKMPNFWKRQVRITKDRICIVGEEDNRFGVGRTARAENPEALAGFHATNLLYVIDEASGIDEAIFVTAEGALSTAGSKVLMMSNPTRTEGYFHKSHVDDAEEWECFSFDCRESPHVDKKWVAKMKRKYGEDSDIFRVRVAGQFPQSSADVLIPLHLVDEARGRDVSYPASKRIAGLDVARFGDDASALVIRRGGEIAYVETWMNKDTMWTVGHVAKMFRDDAFDVVCVDVIGIGAGVSDRLKELNIPVIEVNVSEAPSSRDKFHKLRDELWWKCKEFFEARSCRIVPEIMDNRDFTDFSADLCRVRYQYLNGKIKVESKADMKKRIGKSPDMADALNLTFAHGVTGQRAVMGNGGSTSRKVVKPGNELAYT